MTDSSLDTLYNELTDEQKRSPKYAVAGITVAEGLEANLFASEPTITNPTNIDVDHRGRVWVCEAYNYRPAITGNPAHAEGDRIVILEDTDGDGKSDKSKVFYQGPEVNAPLGILVMGNRVLVSQSPYVWLLTDTDGDDKADKKEVIFQGIKGEQHDHGMHAFVFGPDGKLYFNFGNEGGQLLDGKGNAVLDKDGKPLDFKKNRMGMVFRCDPDFTNVEILGNNFRNNYEVAIDSYGTLWQSDNDDDGNKGVRINYVMPYGNYGYQDELTGAGWRANRTNMEEEIPLPPLAPQRSRRSAQSIADGSGFAHGTDRVRRPDATPGVSGSDDSLRCGSQRGALVSRQKRRRGLHGLHRERTGRQA